MIRSFRDRDTQSFYEGRRVPRFEGFRAQGEKRMTILNQARTLDDLRSLPSNRLEALSGNRRGQYSIRINRQWRICFEWYEDEGDAHNVEIVDYH